VSEALFYLVSSFWLGALHAATPGHGKTIAAAYIVGARGRPVDAVVLGIFVTLSHTFGIVLVAVLASLGAGWAVPARVEAYLALATALLVVAIGLWMLRGQWSGLFPRAEIHRHAHDHEPPHDHGHDSAQGHSHAHDHEQDPAGGHVHDDDPALGYHRHGFGPAHSHRLDLFAEGRPSWGVLLGLGIAGGLLPDPGALAILLAAIASGKVVLALFTVLVFSVGFAAVLVVVGVVAARAGQLVLVWLSSRWLLWLQLVTALLILGIGIVLSANAWRTLARLG
jgi:nickel/cobalt exporter